MKRVAIVVVLALFSVSAWGDIYDWKTDLDAGLEQAAEEEKHVFLYFAGSDWCSWCQRLKSEVLDTRPFREFSEENLVPVLIDFPQDREQSQEQQAYNKNLAAEYEVEGFPTIFLLTPEEDIVLKTGYRRGGPAAYVDHLRSAMRR